MKKLALSTLVLLSFSLSILIFQASCKKEAKADVQSKQQSIILLSRYENTAVSLYTANIDGTNLKKLPIPDAYGDIHGRITSDGQNIVVSLHTDKNYSNRKIYTCSIDGNNLKELSGLSEYDLTDAY